MKAALVALLLSCCAAAAAAQQDFEATVTHVSDGDTLWVRTVAEPAAPRGRRLKLRLRGLDAPERCQPHGERATAALARQVLGRRVAVHGEARDSHGRLLAVLSLDGDDVGAWLVGQGHAWSARWHGDPGPYAGEEAAARRARRGLFAEPEPEPPRDFRRRHGPCP
ncbi:MAG TPA: thermonuclease family protein [Methylibium sp.]|nr:thermonuclease family protein [Methylibium sp.]